eukprot:CAMPEP_0185160758 /NCGR_PEP_ID=MMETSP1139-20130426/3896_1 /TAXON_ID=298111 /ORGANISM="Pavlova sp., Strain CCMP459" /LENGTH=522 /DNA_ID=CAMNT_0027725977 /DNA_START=96 /DNA_END=1664 /DNA_ORIENTATION=+
MIKPLSRKASTPTVMRRDSSALSTHLEKMISLKKSLSTIQPAPKTLAETQYDEGSHFSNLLFGGNVWNTALEWGLRIGLVAAGTWFPQLNVTGSQTLTEMGLWLMAQSVFIRGYNAFLEWVFFNYPEYRTQPTKAHALNTKTDLVGREIRLLEAQKWNDRGTMCLDIAWNLLMYYTIPGYYPGRQVQHSLATRALRLVLHQYAMSYAMYWVHRAGHVSEFEWKYLHGVHHHPTTPLSRVTYQSHPIDNWQAGMVGQSCAQVLVPLDHATFYVHIFLRIMESLEKHSGISCAANLAHSAQRVFPFSQMPHHHDWHHEGHKSCNFSFSAIGGFWDWLFGTRMEGRAQYCGEAATATDWRMIATNQAIQEEAARRARAAEAADSDTSKVSLDDLAGHNSEKTGVWMAIGGVVYDATAYLDEHPGGRDALLGAAGRDATEDYNAIGHSKAALDVLEKMRVADLRGAVAGGDASTPWLKHKWKFMAGMDDPSFWDGHVSVHVPLVPMFAAIVWALKTNATGVFSVLA